MTDYTQEIEAFKEIVAEATEILNDPKAVQAYMTAYNEIKGDMLPAVLLLKDTLGFDADNAVDTMIKWSAKKTFVAYVAYQTAGFNKKEAMQLTLNAREDLVTALRNVKTNT